MANLTEVSNFDAGVYRIETTDAVIGGENGISNKGAKNLANRTKWLKDQVTTILADLSIDDAAITDYATRIAAIESSKVQDIGTNFADGVVILSPAPTATVNGADVRKLNIIDLGNLNCTITLPNVSGLDIGTNFSFAVIISNGTYAGGKTSFVGAGIATILGPATDFYEGDVVTFTKKAASVWIVSNVFRTNQGKADKSQFLLESISGVGPTSFSPSADLTVLTLTPSATKSTTKMKYTFQGYLSNTTGGTRSLKIKKNGTTIADTVLAEADSQQLNFCLIWVDTYTANDTITATVAALNGGGAEVNKYILVCESSDAE